MMREWLALIDVDGIIAIGAVFIIVLLILTGV